MLIEALVILALGDSLVQPGPHSTVTPWPDVLELINEGAAGSRTAQWADPVLLNRVTRHAPVDLVLLHVGANDLFAGMLPAEYGQELERTAQAILASDAALLMLIPPALIWDKHTAMTEAYHLESERLCQASPVDAILCGPDLRLVLLPEHYTPPDPVHPNQAGHNAMAAAIGATLVPEPDCRAAELAVLALLGAMVALWGMKR